MQLQTRVNKIILGWQLHQAILVDQCCRYWLCLHPQGILRYLNILSTEKKSVSETLLYLKCLMSLSAQADFTAFFLC